MMIMVVMLQQGSEQYQPSCPNVLVNSSQLLSWVLSTEGRVRLSASRKSSLVILPMSSSAWSLKSIQVLATPSSPSLQGVQRPSSTLLNRVASCSLRTGSQTASLMSVMMSLPLQLSVRVANFSKSGSLSEWESIFMLFFSIPSLAVQSGREMQILRSNLRRMAGSKAQGRLVAPRTSTPVSSWPTPCICTRNSVLALLEASPSPSVRLPHMESISSMKITAGLHSLARVNSALMSFSVSPTYLLVRSADETEKKVELASVAQAFARKVFPVPGGPQRRMPFQGLRFPMKISLNLVGRITASFSAFLAFSSPETSSQCTLGLSVTMASSICCFSPFASFFAFPPFPPFVMAFWGDSLPSSLLLRRALSSFILVSYSSLMGWMDSFWMMNWMVAMAFLRLMRLSSVLSSFHSCSDRRRVLMRSSLCLEVSARKEGLGALLVGGESLLGCPGKVYPFILSLIIKSGQRHYLSHRLMINYDGIQLLHLHHKKIIRQVCLAGKVAYR